MRFYAALLLIGFLAFAALPTDAAGRYNLLGIGAVTCEAGASNPGTASAADSAVWFAALLRATCSLDSALLRLEQYGRTDDGDVGEPATRLMSTSRQRIRVGR